MAYRRRDAGYEGGSFSVCYNLVMSSGFPDWKSVLSEFNNQSGGRGNILKTEVCHLIQKLGIKVNSEAIENILEQRHISDRSVSFDDFMEVLNDVISTQHFSEEELIDAFKVFDKEGNGYIDTSKLSQVMSDFGDKLTPAEVEEMVQEADTNGRGQVKYADFVRTLLGE